MRSKQISIFVLASLMLLPFLGYDVFAQENQEMSIATLKGSYAAGEPIEITGLVESKVTNEKVTLRIYNPLNTLITIKELEVNNDGTFDGKIPTSATSQSWKKDGTYTIIANYYATQPATTQFEYGGFVSAEVKNGTTSDASEIAITKENDDSKSLMFEDYELEYEISGAKIIQITPDFEMKSLIIEIETYGDGELRITFPKDVIDTDEEGFFVLVDGIETGHEAVLNDENWSFVIPFSNRTQEIEIIGTYVIPEFGTIAALILVISIGTIIGISMKNKQIFYPKI